MLLEKKAYSLPSHHHHPQNLDYLARLWFASPSKLCFHEFAFFSRPGMAAPLVKSRREFSKSSMALSSCVFPHNSGLRFCYKHCCSEKTLCAWESCGLVSMNAVSLKLQSPKQVLIFVPDNKDRIQKKTMLFGNIYVLLSRLMLQ